MQAKHMYHSSLQYTCLPATLHSMHLHLTMWHRLACNLMSVNAGLPAAAAAACHSVAARLTSLQQQHQQLEQQQQPSQLQQHIACDAQLQVTCLLALLLMDTCRLLTIRDSVMFDRSHLLLVKCAAADLALPLLRAAEH